MGSFDEFYDERSFGRTSLRERRNADLFFDELIGRRPRRARRRAESWSPPPYGAETVTSVETGTVTMPPMSVTVRPYMTLDQIVYRDDDFLPSHSAGITRVAHLIADSQGSPEPITSVRLVGHTDSRGRGPFNRTLGENRAKKVRDFLVSEMNRFSAGLSGRVTITVQSQGEDNPRASNSTSTGRARNRRVAIYVASTCQAFLAQYDLRTMPGTSGFGVNSNPEMSTTEKANRIADVASLVRGANPILIDRRNARATAAMSGATGTVPSTTAVPASHAPQTNRLSRVQLDLFREFTPNGSGGIDFARAGECMEGFANGDLRSPITASVAEPNGGFFFLFAEFAFLCIDSSIDTAEWTGLLRPFVMAQEMFIRAYPPTSRDPTVHVLDNYSFTNFNAAGQFTNAQKATLRTRYAPMNLAALKNAARDNMRTAIAAVP